MTDAICARDRGDFEQFLKSAKLASRKDRDDYEARRYQAEAELLLMDYDQCLHDFLQAKKIVERLYWHEHDGSNTKMTMTKDKVRDH